MCYTMFRSMMVCMCHVDPIRLYHERIRYLSLCQYTL